MNNMLFQNGSPLDEYAFLAYMVGGLIWFLAFAFLKDQPWKQAFAKSIIWPWYMLLGVQYWNKKNSFFANRAEYITNIHEIKNDPNYETNK